MTTTLEKKIKSLPPDMLQQVEDFIRDLQNNRKRSGKPRRFKFDWEGALSHLKDKYTSVELQHKILNDWGD